MKKHISIISAAILLLATGCNKSSFSGKGGEISFGTSTQGMATRTEYGDYNAARNHQAINWLENDQIRIVSDQAAVYNDGSGLNYADYKVTGVTNTAGGGISTAKVACVAANGLAWKDNYDGEYAFYAVYPSTAPISAETATLGQVTGSISATPALAASSTTKYIKVVDGKIQEVETEADAEYTYNVYAPDMTGALMTAKAENVKESNATPQVSLLFKPAFTAIEINLTSADEDGFTVSEVSLSAESDVLAGNYTMTAGDDETLSTVAAAAGATSSVTVTPSSALSITDKTGVTLTLLTLPITNTGLITLTVKTGDGNVAKLKLTGSDKNSAYQFLAGKKYNINLLKLGGKFTYAIALAGEALPWEFVEKSTTYTENVQAKAFSIEGALETLESYTNAQSTMDLYGKATSNHYESYDTGTNNDFKTYAEWVALGDGQAAYNGEHKTYYQLYYQLRTLNTNVNNPHFEVTFTPIAPFGGYWNLSAESAPSFGNTAQGGTEGFRIVLWDGESELDSWSSGQIMNQTVTLRIYPLPSRDATKEYCMLIKSFFSPNKNGEPTYSADSEIQDVHGDGRYSYWKFVIPATE